MKNIHEPAMARSCRTVAPLRIGRTSCLRPIGAAGVLFGSLASAVAASGADKSFNSADGIWANALHWLPAGVPGPNDDVSIGNLAIAVNGVATLETPAQIASLAITDEASLYVVNGGSLIVNGPTTVSGGDPNSIVPRSFMAVVDGPFPWDGQFETLTLSDSSHVTFAGSGVIVTDLLTVSNTTLLDVAGSGVLFLTGPGPVGLRNDGTIRLPATPFLITFVEARVDLDGFSPSDSVVDLVDLAPGDVYHPELTLGGTGLTDAMDGQIYLSPGARLNMELDEGWTLGKDGLAMVVNFDGDSDEPARISGSPLVIEGDVDFIGHASALHVESEVTVAEEASISVREGCFLLLEAPTIVDGGSILSETDGLMTIGGPLTLRGGHFDAELGGRFASIIQFAGPTSYDGDVTLDGLVDHIGDVSVVGPSTLHIDRFTLDGFSGTTSWSFSNAMHITVGSPFQSFVGPFDGEFKLTGTFLGKLTVDFVQSGFHWELGGLLDVGGVFGLMITRVEGAPCHVIDGGTIGVAGHARITADVQLKPGATIDFADISARLRLAGSSRIDLGAVLVGGGTLEIESGADLTIGAGVDFFTSSLWSAGTVTIADGPGSATVSSFSMQPSSLCRFELGGPIAGVQGDMLGGNKPSTIGGTLDIRLIDIGNGVFQPAVGTSLTIMKVAGANSVSGMFNEVLPSFAPGKVYRWSVTKTSTQSTSVNVKVTEIIPCPGELTGDGVVDAADLAVLLGAWGPCLGCAADFDQSGGVDASDLGILLGAWGACQV